MEFFWDGLPNVGLTVLTYSTSWSGWLFPSSQRLLMHPPPTPHGIDGNTRWEVKGNMTPTIATTNTIIAGIIVLLSRKRQTNLVPDGLVAYSVGNPKNGCGVCRDRYGIVKCDPERTTFGAMFSVFVRMTYQKC